jgi:hypothetical protein
MQQVSVFPNPQHIDEVRGLFLERLKTRQASGIRVSLTELVAGAKTPKFVVSTLYDDLAAFEAARKFYQSDAGSQSFMANIGSLVREPLAFDLLEVLVPMPG